MPDPALVRMLGVHPFFAGLDPDALGALADLGVSRSLDAGETLFLKGDPGDALYAIRRGGVRIVTGTEEGRRLTLNMLGPGDVFGEIALLDGRPRTADAIGDDPAELFVLRRHDFLDLLKRHPELSSHVVQLLCARLRWMSERMEEAVLQSLPVRLARRLAALCDDYGAELHVSQEALAGFVGGTRESVNRQLRQWQAKGVVRLARSRVQILDRARLARLPA